MTAPLVKYKVLRPGAVAPEFMTDGSAGADLRAFPDSAVVIEPGAFASIPTGIAIAIPAGYEGEVRPRSGLAAKFGVTVLNSPGTIDSDYRGEVCVILINHGNQSFRVERGDRIAQLLIKPVFRSVFEQNPELDSSNRGDGGFGSTGI